MPLTIKTGNGNNCYNIMSGLAIRNHNMAGSSYTNGYMNFFLIGDPGNAYATVWGIESNDGNMEYLLIGQYGSGSFEFDNAFEGAVNFTFATES